MADGEEAAEAEPSAEQLGLALNYAGDWFHYHAQQRVQAFYLFLVVQSAVIVALATVYNGHKPQVASYVALLGALLTIPFWLLEIRNTELVNNGRYTVDWIEDRLMQLGTFPDLPRQRDKARADFPSATLIYGLRPRAIAEFPPMFRRDIPVDHWYQRLRYWYQNVARHSVIFRTLFLFALVVEGGISIWLLVDHGSSPVALGLCSFGLLVLAVTAFLGFAATTDWRKEARDANREKFGEWTRDEPFTVPNIRERFRGYPYW